jgi:hypothetical protein
VRGQPLAVAGQMGSSLRARSSPRLDRSPNFGLSGPVYYAGIDLSRATLRPGRRFGAQPALGLRALLTAPLSRMGSSGAPMGFYKRGHLAPEPSLRRGSWRPATRAALPSRAFFDLTVRTARFSACFLAT